MPPSSISLAHPSIETTAGEAKPARSGPGIEEEQRETMSGNFKWVLLAVLCAIAIGFLHELTQTPEERAAKAEQRAKQAEQAAQRKGRER